MNTACGVSKRRIGIAPRRLRSEHTDGLRTMLLLVTVRSHVAILSHIYGIIRIMKQLIPEEAWGRASANELESSISSSVSGRDHGSRYDNDNSPGSEA